MSLPNERETRIERYLGVIAQDGRTKPNKPETRIERYLDVIATESVINDARISNIEKALENDVITESFEAFTEPQTLPENVLPNGYINSISGKTTTDGGENEYNTPQSVEIEGSNKFNINEMINYYVSSEGKFTKSPTNSYERSVVINIEPNTTYTFTTNQISNDNQLRIGYFENYPIINELSIIYSGQGKSRTITLTSPNNAHYVCVFFWNVSNTNDSYVKSNSNIMVSKTDSEVTYKPYTPNIILQSDKIVEIKNKLVSLGYSIDELGYSTANKSNYIDYTNKKVVLNCYLPVSQIVSEYLEPIEIDVSDIIDDGDMLLTHLENGGTITCISEHDIDLPFETTIYEKVV